MKQYVIGDIHGHFDLLRKTLDWVEEQEQGEVIFLGDYIDRGPKNKEVVDLLMAGPPEGWRWTTIRGNHEDMAIEAYRKGKDEVQMWLINGGKDTLENYKSHRMPSEVIEFFKKMPRYKWDDHRIFTHAAVSRTLALEDQSEYVTQWARFKPEEDYPVHDRYVVHGHTPQRGEPFVGNHRCNLDIGGVWSNSLAVAIFDKNIAGPPLQVKLIDISLYNLRGYLE